MKTLFVLISLLGLILGMGGALNAQEASGDTQSKLDTIFLYGDFPQDGNSHTVSFKFSATPGEKFIIRWGDYYSRYADTILVENANETEQTYTYSKEYISSGPRFSIGFYALTSNGHFKSLRIDSTYKYRELVCQNCILLDTVQVTHNNLEHIDFRNCPALTFWDCSYNKITSLYFWPNSNWYDNLTYLNCSHNDIKEFTATDGISLQTLDCSYNPNLWTLRTDDCKALKSLDCSYTLLSALYLPTQSILQTLDCSNTQLTTMYLSELPTLQTLDCSNTQLNSMYLSELPALRTLDCSDNPQLTQLTIQCPSLDTLLMNRNTQLFFLFIYDSRLTGIDLSDNTALIGIILQNNTMLENLNLSNLSVLKQLTCTNSPKLKSLDCSPQLESLDLSMAALQILDCSNTQLTSLNLSELPALQTLDCSNTQLTSLNLLELPVLQTLDCSNTQLPSLNMSELPALQTLNCNNTPLTHLYLSNFPALQTLTCQSTQLTTLSLSELPALKTLDCSDNPQLTDLSIQCLNLDSLRVHGNTQLTSLHVSYSCLTDLDLSGNTQLTSLDCYHNQLSSLDVTDCHNLRYINCTNNHLSFIDLPKEFAGFISCDSNHIPLSVLASLLKQCENASFSPQLIALPPLPIEQTLDLRSEMQGSDYNVEYTVYLDGTEVDNRFYTIRNGLFAFRKAGNYRVILSSELPLGMPMSGSVYYDLTVVDSIARPTFSIPSGAVVWPDTTLVLSTATPNAQIYYTIDGGEPDEMALAYTAPIRITEAMTIKAVAIYKTLKSQVSTATYTMDTVARPTFSIPSGTVKIGSTVSLSTTTPDARIIYTTDGTEPDNNALEYTEPIRITEAMTIKAVAIYKTLKSQVSTATYTMEAVNDTIIANEHDLRGSKLRVYTKDRTIYLSEASEIEVFTMDGHCVYRGFDTAIPVKRSGIYIVSAAGKRWKVAVVR